MAQNATSQFSNEKGSKSVDLLPFVGMRRPLVQSTTSQFSNEKSSKTVCFAALCRDEATRTPDPYVPNVVRYQLRYIPFLFCSMTEKRVQRYGFFLNHIHIFKKNSVLLVQFIIFLYLCIRKAAPQQLKQALLRSVCISFASVFMVP